ncbi:SDR family oxidoreductase [Planctomonas sp. JC2975]|uniref:SDR family NAD(P)-dependent oxidoreductase n=1 Tax=Planctomonas sp. JC2975 TaxID=2729626 RepID=UPI0014754070|nr:SDR family NAD(P)-dependent oxidoreductase [Planctomonas sp. JC2975]NNC13531.1 SDR family oxidoreductase [Planctomonas sp. JC2975]
MVADFEGRVAVVIGGASGMGRATAELFAARGAKVSVSDLDAERGAAVVDELRGRGSEAIFTRADIRVPSELAELARRTLEAFGGVDAVFLSAGRVEADLGPMLELYLQGPANVVAAMLPGLEASDAASITFTGSTSGLKAHPGAPWYAAAKAGLVGMTRTLAVDLARKGIRVNAVCPSGVDTPMLRATMRGTEQEIEAKLAEQAARKPLGRWVTASDVANAAVFLASSQAAMITGVSLPVDGGDSL